MKKGIGFIVVLLLVGGIGCEGDGRSSSDEAQYNGGNEPQQQESGAMKEGTADRAASSSEPSRRKGNTINPPNGAEYDNMHFKHYGTNPFIDTEEDALSTFAVDVDTGSYTVMRNYVKRGALPPPEAVRVEEFINYFDTNVPSPQEKRFAVQTDGGDAPFAEGYQLLRVGVKGTEIPEEQRKQANLVFVVDVSGSMDRENRLGLVKRSLRLLVDELKAHDRIGIVVYGSEARTVLSSTAVENRREIIRAIDQLHPGGSTNAEEGLNVGYRMARDHFQEGAVNRVILCSDGVANTGETGASEILDTIERYAGERITLSALGFGMGNYNDVLMEQLANRGNGHYAYIDSYSEVRQRFTENLTGNLQMIAKDMKIQVAFDPEQVERYRLLGYENRDVDDEDFENDRVDAGEVGAGHTVTALYELKLHEASAGSDLGEVRLRYRDMATGTMESIHEPISLSDELNRDMRFLASVAEYAEILRGSYWAKKGSLQDVLELARSSAQGNKQIQFVELVKNAVAIDQGTDDSDID